jgi:hypothetical protein
MKSFVNTKSQEWSDMFKIDNTLTDMGPDEALEIVLGLARETKLLGDDSFEWEQEHDEACHVVQKFIDERESGGI